ncbi:hypothetical protein Gorai_024267, partial [Gossypium raimondii]|nr:hypothetical protein [Gossypium raimondii]
DAWLVGAENYKVYGNISDSSLIKVYDLIDHSCKNWNVGLIRSTFEESVEDKILRIPLARLEHEDVVMWRGEPSGVFLWLEMTGSVIISKSMLHGGVTSPFAVEALALLSSNSIGQEHESRYDFVGISQVWGLTRNVNQINEGVVVRESV